MSSSTNHAAPFGRQPTLAAAHAERMTRLDRARWNLAVLVELAQPGHMALTPVLDDGGEVIDFACQEASPTATLALGCAGEDLVGRTLKQVLNEYKLDASVFSSYRAVFFQKQAQVVCVNGPHGVTMHRISPLPASLSVEVACAAAVDRARAAQQAVQELE